MKLWQRAKQGDTNHPIHLAFLPVPTLLNSGRVADALRLRSDGERVPQKAPAAVRGEAGLGVGVQERAGAAGTTVCIPRVGRVFPPRFEVGGSRREPEGADHVMAFHLHGYNTCCSLGGVESIFSACGHSALEKNMSWGARTRTQGVCVPVLLLP